MRTRLQPVTKELPQPSQAGRPFWQWFFWAVSALVTLAPAATVALVISTTGADNLSNDYLQYASLIDRILSGHYQWASFITDTFYRTHSVAIPVALHALNAKFFSWNIYLELYAGLTLAAARLLLLYYATSRFLPGYLKTALLPFLSCLIFSLSQISVFAYGDGALTIELSLFGFALGLAGLASQRQYLGPVLMVAGGLISSFSWGNGLVTWMILLVSLLLLNYRRLPLYLLWFAGLLVSALPYINALVIRQGSAPVRDGTTVVSLTNFRFFINALGWPFANGISSHAEGLPEARLVAWAGLACAAVLLCLLARASRQTKVAALPGLLCMLHGLVSIWQISVFRTLIAAWYTAVSMTFWCGLIACAAAVYAGSNQKNGRAERLSRQACLAISLIVLDFYMRSNLTYDDKTDLLYSRSPASASALRHYLDGPTYAEQYVFQWGSGNPGLLTLLASPLAKHKLSVFAPEQIWTLQGDYLLDAVTVDDHKENGSSVAWTATTSERDKMPWWHYRHLNLLLPAGKSVSWTVTVPAGASKAEFRSAVALPREQGASTPVFFAVGLKPSGGKEILAWNLAARSNNQNWREFALPLEKYKGQTITLRLSARAIPHRPGVNSLFRYPCIYVSDYTKNTFREGPCLPSNTELNAGTPERTDFDYVFPVAGKQSHPIESGRVASTTGVVLPARKDWKMTVPCPGQPDLSAYSHWQFCLSAPWQMTPRAVTASLTFLPGQQPVSFTVPLLPDAAKHTYSYDLKLLELPRYSRLTAVQLMLANNNSACSNDAALPVVLYDLRLVKKAKGKGS